MKKPNFLIVGGGFYGISIALHLRTKFPLSDICILEQNSKLMSRASYINQARVHNGYHYPRSFMTAYRSRINLPKFCSDFPFAIKKDFVHLYGIARRSSKVNAIQFKKFCQKIGAKVTVYNGPMRKNFNLRLIEEVFEVEEYAFDSIKIFEWLNQKLTQSKIEVRLNTRFDSNSHDAKFVFNATYSGLNSVVKTSAMLKHEIAEMVLIRPPSEIHHFGITIMDGPFFSIMPFPSSACHSLSHVRYTPSNFRSRFTQN